MSRVMRWIGETPNAVLLAVQIAGVLLYPFMEVSRPGRALFSLFSMLVLVLAVVAVRATPALTWVAILIGVPLVMLTAFETADRLPDDWETVSALLHSAFYFYAVYALIRYLFDDSHVTRDEIYAIGAAFTVAAWAFTYLYVGAQLIWPGSFGPQRSWMDLLFLSFTTLTSTGLSDITPVLPNARSFVMMEQIAGLMYVAFVMARMVALTVRRFP